MYLGGTVVWMDDANPTYYVMWNNSATFNVYLNGKEVDAFTFTAYGLEYPWQAIDVAHQWMAEDDPDYYNFE